jgi:hypothetical protein
VGKPGVQDVSAIRAGSARYLGSNNDLTAVQPNLNKTVKMDWTQGSNAVQGSSATTDSSQQELRQRTTT